MLPWKQEGRKKEKLETNEVKFVGLVSVWSHHEKFGMLVPQPGIELMPSATEAQRLNHWTTMEDPSF